MRKTGLFLITFIAVFSLFAGAESFHFRGKGFFSTRDGKIDFAPFQFNGEYRLKIDGIPVVRVVGPIFAPGYRTAPKHNVKVELKNKRLVDTQKVKNSSLSYTQNFTEVNGGILAEIDIDSLDKSVKQVSYRFLFPVKHNKGKRVIWDMGKSIFPENKKDKNIFHDTKDKLKTFRFEIGQDLELGIKILSPVKWKVLRDCRHHASNEQNYDLALRFEGKKLRYFICLLKPSEKFPSIDKKQNQVTSSLAKKGNLLKEGASFETGADGVNFHAFYEWIENFTSPATPIVLDDTTAVHGKYSVKLTAEDLTLKNGRFRKVLLEFNRVPLEPNRKYTVSAWLKADRPGIPVYLRCDESEKGIKIKPLYVKPTTEWKRYQLSFTTPKVFPVLGYYLLYIGIGGDRKLTGTVWVDAVQLEEGDATDFTPSLPFEFGVKIPGHFKLFEKGKNIPVILSFRNNGTKNIQGKVTYIIKDFWEKAVAEGAVKVAVEKDSTKEQIINLGAFPPGYYRAYFTAPGGEVEEGIFGVYNPMDKSKVDGDWPIAGHYVSEEVNRRLGFGLARVFDFKFARICPEKGKFNFKETDIIVDRAEKNGFTLMPVFGHAFRHASTVPEWSRKSGGPTAFVHGREIFVPTLEAWKIYIRAIVERYKDRVKYWEVINEPNTHLSAEAYFPYLKAAYEAAKEVDPDCIIVGGCATSDLGGEPAPWTCRLLELGGWKYFDILSTHFYGKGAPEGTRGMGTDKYFDYLVQKMKKYGKDAPVWHTEKTYTARTSGYSPRKFNRPYAYEPDPTSPTKDFKTKAEYMIRENLLSASSGKGPFFWFGGLPNRTSIMFHMYPDFRGNGHCEYDDSPMPELLAANGLANVLKGHYYPQGQLYWGGINRCALFSSDKGKSGSIWDWLFGKSGSSVVAVWNWQGKSSISIPTNMGKLEVYDFFGNKTDLKPDKKGRINLELETAPKYIVFPELNAAGARKLLDKVSLVGGEKISQYGCCEMQSGKPAICVYIKNNDISSLDGKVEISSIPSGWKMEAMEKEFFNLKPGQNIKLAFPLANVQPVNDIVNVDITTKVHDKLYKLNISVLPFSSDRELQEILSPPRVAVAEKVQKNSIKIDGDLSEWSKSNNISVAVADNITGEFGKWQGVDDLSISVKFRWDENFFYVGATVYDDRIIRNSAKNVAWSSDSFELFMDLDDKDLEYDRTTKDTYAVNKDDFQGVFAPPSGKKSHNEASAWWMQLKSSANAKVASKRVKGGYTMEIAIPWKTFTYNFTPAVGKEIGFSFIVNDSDVNESPESPLICQGTTINYQSPKKWGRLKFE